jgi:predicted Zn-dependent protease
MYFLILLYFCNFNILIMNHFFKVRLILLAFLVLIVTNCATNPITGRKSMEIVGNSQLFPMAFQQYGQFISQAKVLNTPEAKKIDEIGKKLVVAANNWYKEIGQPDYLKDYQWEFKLVDDKQVNAWAMPGGKIVFYSGIMPVLKDDAGIACVMGHEIAHAILDHGKERMNAAYKQQFGGQLLSVAFSSKSPETQKIIQQVYGGGSQMLGMLPYSRKHEFEADETGLMLMAMAGYNPELAIPFWERMEKMSSGQAPPEYMSTHPSYGNRIQHVKNVMPKAKERATKYGHKF